MTAEHKALLSTATAEDLPLLAGLADQFFASSRFLKGFRLEQFCRVWRDLLKSGVGVIFLLSDEDGIQGALGGVAYPDINSGVSVASEFFWFVSPPARGQGLELYRAFEEWARRVGCQQIRMVHLMDSMPERLSVVYKRLGFEAAEVVYVKELN